jgi:hypothetical protein
LRGADRSSAVRFTGNPYLFTVTLTYCFAQLHLTGQRGVVLLIAVTAAAYCVKTSLARKLQLLCKTRTHGHPQNGALDQARPFMASPESTVARWGLSPSGPAVQRRGRKHSTRRRASRPLSRTARVPRPGPRRPAATGRQSSEQSAVFPEFLRRHGLRSPVEYEC